MDSIWTKTVTMPSFPALEGDIKTDVLIIGGGMAGILCAYFLQEQGVDYLLAEGRNLLRCDEKYNSENHFPARTHLPENCEAEGNGDGSHVSGCQSGCSESLRRACKGD